MRINKENKFFYCKFKIVYLIRRKYSKACIIKNKSKGRDMIVNSLFDQVKKEILTQGKEIEKFYSDKKKFQQALKKIIKVDRVIRKQIEIKLDNGKKTIFEAFRSQHNRALGPYKGGVRFHLNVNEDEVMVLSTWMSLKCAIANLPYGGGKGGIKVNPRKLSLTELERLSKAYSRSMFDKIGPWTDILAPDVNTNSQIMGWMVAEYEKQAFKKNLPFNAWASFTGKPLELGGSLGREEATGLGGVYILESLIKVLNLKPNLKIAVQGFGNVGYNFAKKAEQKGFLIVAIFDSSGGIYQDKGLKINEVLELKKQKGKIADIFDKTDLENHRLGKFVKSQDFISLPVDILVPAALENVINKSNVSLIQASYIIEMANGPIDLKVDSDLVRKNIMVIPDILANCGGVSVSYFEWVQNLSNYYWSKDEVLLKLKNLMETAFLKVWQYSIDNKLSIRQGAYQLALKKIIDAELIRGLEE